MFGNGGAHVELPMIQDMWHALYKLPLRVRSRSTLPTPRDTDTSSSQRSSPFHSIVKKREPQNAKCFNAGSLAVWSQVTIYCLYSNCCIYPDLEGSYSVCKPRVTDSMIQQILGETSHAHRRQRPARLDNRTYTHTDVCTHSYTRTHTWAKTGRCSCRQALRKPPRTSTCCLEGSHGQRARTPCACAKAC